MIRYILIIILAVFIPATAIAEGMIRDAEVEAVITNLARPIFNVAGLNPRNVSVYIYQSEDANAFVPEGKNIFLSSKLIAYSDEPYTLAGVIAHEVGHITSGHIQARKGEMINMQRKAMLSSVVGALAGIATKSPEVFLGTSSIGADASVQHFMHFSRNQEAAADHAALKYLNKIGLDNRGLLDFLEFMKGEERINSYSSYLQTHPVSNERIQAIRNFNNNNEFSQKGEIGLSLHDHFKRIVVKIRAFTYPAAEVLKHYGNDNSLHGLYAQAIAYLRVPQHSKALELTDRLLMKEPNNPYFHELKGQILLEMRNVSLAIEEFKKAHTILPKNALVKYEYALVLNMAKTSTSKAISLLEEAVAAEPEFPTFWRQLGIAYGHAHDSLNSNLALAQEAIIKDDAKAAKRMVAIAEKDVMKSTDKRTILRFKDIKQALAIMEENE